MSNPLWDVVVVGGGPAGSTAAGLLAERGWRVLLLEQSLHPRFHIGESLLPNNLPILERLGVLEKVRDIGVLKPGADFTDSGEHDVTQNIRFADALGDTPSHAFQVRRAEFDELLFENAGRLGAVTREDTRVTHVERQSGNPHLHLCTEQGDRFSTRFVLDASGRHGFLARRNRWRRRSTRHASAALFGHFRGVTPRTDERRGNISVYWFEHGWMWMIPLQGDVMSVGAVCRPGYLKARDTDAESFLRETVALNAEARSRMAGARVLGGVQVTGNYSYETQETADAGQLLIGDAHTFIDPVFSSGVYLAMRNAVECIPVVERWLRDDQPGFWRLAARLDRASRRRVRAFSWFIYRFTTPTMKHLFNHPRPIFGVKPAVTSMLAGDGDGSWTIRFRLRLFRCIYYGHALAFSLQKERAALMRSHREADRTARAVQFDEDTIMDAAPVNATAQLDRKLG